MVGRDFFKVIILMHLLHLHALKSSSRLCLNMVSNVEHTIYGKFLR